MKITIGTTSNSLGFEENLKLIRASLLYADEIELIGMPDYAVFRYLPSILNENKSIGKTFRQLKPLVKVYDQQKGTDLESIFNYSIDQLDKIQPYLDKKKCRTKQEIQAQIKLKKFENDIKEQLSPLKNQDNPNAESIQRLINNKYVSVFDYGIDILSSEKLAGGYLASLMNSVSAKDSFPLFDDLSNKIIRDMSAAKLIDLGKVKSEKLRHAGVASSVLMTLPSLESATLDELIAIRNENPLPLARFRSAIYKYSEDIGSMPWDDDFEYECLKIYERDVVPSVLEINETFSETSFLKNLGKKALTDEEIRKKASYTIGGIIASISTYSSIESSFGKIMEALLAVSLFGISKEMTEIFLKTIDLGIQTVNEVEEKTKGAKANSMYYYYIASKGK